jgi:hypothetical protein
MKIKGEWHMNGIVPIVSIVISIAISCVFGGITQSVIDKKGYDENWFWWGFFFGWIAVVVAALKSDAPTGYYSNSAPKWMETEPNKELLKKGGWECKCGRINASYTGTCACGRKKNELEKPAAKADKFEEMKRYKELLDLGIVTEEEYEKKKKELLGI